MTKRFFIALALLLAAPTLVLAQQSQAKAWATYSNGVLTFSYGSKPQQPAQVECSYCHKKMAYSTNYCLNCGTQNKKDFVVYDVNEKITCPWCSEANHKPWFEKRSEIKKLVFNPSFKQVTNITSTENWFAGLSNLTTITGLENLNTSKVTNMAGMFSDCSSLKTVDLSHFNTANVTDMNRMFYYCKSLSTIDVSQFKTDKVTDMEHMFCNCESLVSLDVSNFNTANVAGMGMHGMFDACKKLKTLNLSNFNTSKVTSMDGMFNECKSLTSINLSSFNTSQVTGFACMFEQCESLTTLDISNFDTRKATYTAFMFTGCCQLKTVYVSSENWVGLKYSSGTYKPSLMGNEGSTLCRCNAQIIKK